MFFCITVKYRSCLYKYILLCLCVFFDAQSFAEPVQSASKSFDCNQKQIPLLKKDEVIAKVQTAYNKTDTLTASFAQDSFIEALGQSQASTGKMTYKRQGKMRWDYEKPDEQLFLINNGVTYFYQKEDNQVIIDKLNSVLISDLPIAFLMGIGDINKQFKIKTICESNSGFVLELIPEKSKTAQQQSTVKQIGDNEKLKLFKLLIEQDTFFPLGASWLDISENRTSILFYDIIKNSKVGENLFNYDPAKGVDIIDKSQ
jgi:outer membrane lipoprotein-sorting protein